MSERLFAALAARPADQPAFGDGTRTWSAAEVLSEIEALQKRLAGVHTVAVLADNSPAWAIADLAALRSGIAHVPLPTFFSPTQMAHVLEQTSADLVLSDQPERIVALQLGFEPAGEWQGLAAPQQPGCQPAGRHSQGLFHLGQHRQPQRRLPLG